MNNLVYHLAPFESCVEEVITFRNSNRLIPRDRSYFEWRYNDRPCRSRSMIVWGSDARGNKVASASIIPHDFYILDDVYPVGMLGDISVASAYRGRGVATHMLEYLQRQQLLQDLRACIVLPNDEAAHVLERAGWHNVTVIERFVKVVDIDPRLPNWLIGRRGIARMINAITRLAYLDDRPAQKDAPYQLMALEEINDEFDDLWVELPKLGRILSVRDKKYLRWRYQQHPNIDYGIIGIRQGGRLRGYVVFHVAGGAVEIDDYLAVDATAGHWLIKAFLAHVRQAKLAANIHARYNAGSLLALPWTRLGFMRRHDYHRVMASVTSDDMAFSLPPEEENWFVTAGDKDV